MSFLDITVTTDTPTPMMTSALSTNQSKFRTEANE